MKGFPSIKPKADFTGLGPSHGSLTEVKYKRQHIMIASIILVLTSSVF